jgi:hypothetical protein
MLGVLIAVDLITAAATPIATMVPITAIATMATITIIGATLITAIAIGEAYRFVAASKLVIRVGARTAALCCGLFAVCRQHLLALRQAELIRYFGLKSAVFFNHRHLPPNNFRQVRCTQFKTE